jgi:hypothetical protein
MITELTRLWGKPLPPTAGLQSLATLPFLNTVTSVWDPQSNKSLAAGRKKPLNARDVLHCAARVRALAAG